MKKLLVILFAVAGGLIAYRYSLKPAVPVTKDTLLLTNQLATGFRFLTITSRLEFLNLGAHPIYRFTDAQWELIKKGYPEYMGVLTNPMRFYSTNEWARTNQSVL